MEFSPSCFIWFPSQNFCAAKEESRGQEQRGKQPHLPPLTQYSQPNALALVFSVLRVRSVTLLRCGCGALAIGTTFFWPYKYLHRCSCKSEFAWTLSYVVNFGLPTSHHLCCCVFIKTSITRLCLAQWEAIFFLTAFLKQTKKGRKTPWNTQSEIIHGLK